jgi:hypothetical protein
MYPVLKFGYTSDINNRMMYYNKTATYKLLFFSSCKNFLKEREYYIKNWGHSEIVDHCRMTNSEHIVFESGLFKKMYKDVLEATSMDIKKTKNKNDSLTTQYGK